MRAHGNNILYEHPAIDWLSSKGVQVTDDIALVWYLDRKIGDTCIYKFTLTDEIKINNEEMI